MTTIDRTDPRTVPANLKLAIHGGVDDLFEKLDRDFCSKGTVKPSEMEAALHALADLGHAWRDWWEESGDPYE